MLCLCGANLPQELATGRLGERGKKKRKQNGVGKTWQKDTNGKKKGKTGLGRGNRAKKKGGGRGAGDFS